MVWRSEGVPGFYRGFGTVVFGTIPARTIYLTSLEVTKSTMHKCVRAQPAGPPAYVRGARALVPP